MIFFFVLMLLFISSVNATTYFNPPAVTLVQGNPGDTCASNPTACAKSSEVNTNFNQIVTEGNAAKAAIESLLTGVSTAGLPSKAIIAVNAVACPTGYIVADGTNGTPDARGVFIRGLDQGAGVDPGRVIATFQNFGMRNHTHTTTIRSSTNRVFSLTGPDFFAINTYNTISPETQSQSGGGNDTRPANVILLYCSKL